MVAVGNGVAAGLAALVALLAVLEAWSGLGAGAWAVGLGCGGLVVVAVARGAATHGIGVLGPADLVTLARAMLACAVAALVAAAVAEGAAPAPLVPVAAWALALDAVDGRVARATHTTSPFGARFDGEVDAFALLVLSAYVAHSVGAWVLAIGLARYVFGLWRLACPRSRVALPPRPWRKVVAAVQGVVLVVAAAGVVPGPVAVAALVGALALLGESFGRDVVWSWRHRTSQPAEVAAHERLGSRP